MACKFIFYVNKAYDIPIEPAEESVQSIEQLIENIGSLFSITLTMNNTDIIFSTANGRIEITGDTIILLIKEGDIMEPGSYSVKYEYTDVNGSARAIVPCPKRIKFYIQ